MNKESLKKIIKEMIIKEFMAISMGGGSLMSSGQISGGPALPLGMAVKIPSDIKKAAGTKKRRRKTKLNEANSIVGMNTAAWGVDSLEQLIGSSILSDADTEMYSTDTDDTNFPNDKVPKGNKQSNSHKLSPNKHKISSKRIAGNPETDVKALKTSSQKSVNLQLKNPFHKLMWDGDVSVPNVLKVKYVILEQSLKKEKISENNSLHNSTAIIHLDKDMTEEVKNALTNFLQFCQAILNIKEFPEIYVVSERMPGMTTGAYLPSKKIVLALAENRLMIDVFRTIAHELTHCKQHERGELDNLPARQGEDDMSDVNTPYENEAYMNSGNFSKAWARLYKKMSRDEIFSTSM